MFSRICETMQQPRNSCSIAYKNFPHFPQDSPVFVDKRRYNGGSCLHVQAHNQIFPSGLYINPDFHLVLAGYQPAWVMWYIALIPQALVLCLIYTHAPSGLCVYIRQSTRACGISITYTMAAWDFTDICTQSLRAEGVYILAKSLAAMV